MIDSNTIDFQLGRIEELTGALFMIDVVRSLPAKDKLSELARMFAIRLEGITKDMEAQRGSPN